MNNAKELQYVRRFPDRVNYVQNNTLPGSCENVHFRVGGRVNSRQSSIGLDCVGGFQKVAVTNQL